MSTYTQIIYQIVFSTKHRKKCLIKSGREELFKYISGILRNKNCDVLQINGVEDHLHILIKLHPSVVLASLVKDVKVSTHKMIKEKIPFPDFDGWQEGYGAFRYSLEALPGLIQYIQNQQKHHAAESFEDEFIKMLEANGVVFNHKYVFG